MRRLATTTAACVEQKAERRNHLYSVFVHQSAGAAATAVFSWELNLNNLVSFMPYSTTCGPNLASTSGQPCVPWSPCTAPPRPAPPRPAHGRRDTRREAARTDASVGGATAGIIHYKGFALPRGTSAHSGAAVACRGHATLASVAPRRAAHFPFHGGSHA